MDIPWSEIPWWLYLIFLLLGMSLVATILVLFSH